MDQAVQVPENGFLDDGQQYVGHDEAGAEIYDVSTRIGKMKLICKEKGAVARLRKFQANIAQNWLA